MKLNLGCGSNKLEGYINVDCDSKLEPDWILDFKDLIWPWEKSSVSQVVCFHTMEHIPRRYHQTIYSNILGILVPDGELWLTFPDFNKCANNYLSNYKGMKQFWEATIFGRQSCPADFHVCALTLECVSLELVRCGFDPYYQGYEPLEPFNAVIKANKNPNYMTYEDALRDKVWQPG